MKKTSITWLALCLTALLCQGVFGYAKSMYPYTLPKNAQGAALGCEVASNGVELVTGKWYTNFAVCKKYADDNNLPLFAVWSNKSCIHCWYMDVCFIQDSWLTWAASQDCAKVIYCFMAGGEGGYDQQGSSAYQWMWTGGSTKLDAFPFACFWWKEKGVNVHMTGDTLCKGSAKSALSFTDSTIPTRVENIKLAFEKYFGDWHPVTYAGGAFAVTETTGNRLEVETNTTAVVVDLLREGSATTVATNVMCVVKAPSGAVLASNEVAWAANQTNATVTLTLARAGAGEAAQPAGVQPTNTDVTIDLADGVFAKDGEQLTLELVEAGEVQSTTHITCVVRAPSASNPLWIGEKFGFGEWTCDLDAAKELVASTDGAAYTLVSIQGSMWCPDCANTDRNFLDAEDEAGNNRFAAWAKAHNVALVTMDIPNYKSGADTVTNFVSPTIFSKKAFSTTLARAKEYPASGADASLTNAVMRSGLGYLTRKGVSDEDALAVLTKFHDLAVTNTDQGGFHRPEDSNKFRTGVPIFVLLRKDGTVAARFTRFAAVSPMTADQANFDNYIKRFDEMLAIGAESGTNKHADTTEIENNYPGAGAVAFAANGGSSRGELCNADLQDAFRLDGVGGNAVQQVTVTGSADATVSVQFWKKTETGYEECPGEAAKGKLSAGVTLSRAFTESGDYYVLVKGADITETAFNAANATENNFISYKITGATVLVPQTDRAEGKAPSTSNCVTMRLVKDTVYCFAGVSESANTAQLALVKSLANGSAIFKALESADARIMLTTGTGGKVTYQIWQPGTVGFVQTAQRVSEGEAGAEDVWVSFNVARTGGNSGAVTVQVALDEEASTLDAERYEPITAQEFTWADGVTSNQTFKVKILDDSYFTGDQQLVFKLQVTASEAEDVTVVEGKETFTLTVTEDDKCEPGRALITRTTPVVGKAKTVYAKASDGAKIWVSRIEACDGRVASQLKSSLAGVTFTAEKADDIETVGTKTFLWWANRERAEKYVQVTGVPAGKRTTITLATYDTFKAVSGSNTVTVISVADDAPTFQTEASAFTLYRYVAGASVSVALDAATLQDGTVTCAKISGTLPAGLKAAYDATTKALVFTGAPTAKPGTYAVAYQVTEKRGTTKVAGLTTQVTFTIVDPTDLKTNPENANPFVTTSHTVKDIAIVDSTNGTLAGVLQVTIPTRGNASAKYVCANGTIALSAKNWAAYDFETRDLAVRLTNDKLGYAIDLTVAWNGVLDIAVTDPNLVGADLRAYVAGNAWTETTADAWKGYYTVALPVEQVVAAATANLPPTGSGYLTLKMNTTASCKAGRMTWAGMLPNGTAVSGTTVLAPNFKLVRLPVFKTSTTDAFAAYLQIEPNAVSNEVRRCVTAVEGVTATWAHGESRSEVADWQANLGIYGSYYDTTEDLGRCCQEFFEKKTLPLAFDVSKLGTLAVGTPSEITSVNVEVDSNKMSIVSATNPSKVTLSFNRATGVVTGTAQLPYTTAASIEKTLTVSYKGVVLNGWGEGCGCGDFEVYLPFLNGSFYLTDRVTDANTGRTVSVKRGGAATMK